MPIEMSRTDTRKINRDDLTSYKALYASRSVPNDMP
jgi:hypothetical protein